MDRSVVQLNCIALQTVMFRSFTFVVCRHIPMYLGLNVFYGYNPPRNQDHLGPNFMYLGFVPGAASHVGFEVCTV